MSGNLYSLLESRFPADRAKPLLLLESGAALSYGEAERGAARFAALFALLELLPGDRVAVQVEKSPEALLVYLACLRAGQLRPLQRTRPRKPLLYPFPSRPLQWNKPASPVRVERTGLFGV